MLRQVSFGPFTLDAETRQLLRDPERRRSIVAKGVRPALRAG